MVSENPRMSKSKETKSKRYNGKAANVAENIYFEEYMKSVAPSKIDFKKYIKFTVVILVEMKDVLSHVPAGFISMSNAARVFGLRREVSLKYTLDL